MAMKRLSDDIVYFFQNQGCVIVSTFGRNGYVHCSCKGIVKIDKGGHVYLLDLYRGWTYQNLKDNPHISLTAINEHKFRGYCLKGKAKIIPQEEVPFQIKSAWEDRIASRLTQRLLKNIREEKGHPKHPEVMLPKPQYMIVMQVEETVDLIPQHIR
ncbi:MAG: pyridoxamine 5'-phosphate oxidase family protein [Candidatus Omnitrophota bacterium]